MIHPQFPHFSDRIKNIPESFIREILKVSSRPEMISFAGGLPNPDFFPVDKLASAADKVLSKDGKAALQYWITEGYLPLRDYIAQWQSRRMGFRIEAEDVLMLNGSQQGIDLVGKLFLNPGNTALLEGPSYLGAIQAFAAYQPIFHHIEIKGGGPDIKSFNAAMKKLRPAIFYCVPNFQNPTGNTYDSFHREQIASTSCSPDTIWVEDNPYGEIYFEDNPLPNLCSLLPERTVHLGSFSKIISPGIRLGWAVGPREVMRRMAIAKQASDLHSNNLVQRIVYQFLMDNSLDEHLNSIRSFYKEQATLMVRSMQDHFPKAVTWITPEGGMFVWATLPQDLKASLLLVKAIQQNVLFVPGENFYVGGCDGSDSLRMNFSNPSREEIVKGVKIMGELIHSMMQNESPPGA
jgi:2-aminoadipate transaminase